MPSWTIIFLSLFLIAWRLASVVEGMVVLDLVSDINYFQMWREGHAAYTAVMPLVLFPSSWLVSAPG